MRKRSRELILAGVLSVLVLSTTLGCSMCRLLSGASGSGGRKAAVVVPPTNTPQPTFTETATPTNTPIPTDTPTPTDTPVPTNTPVPTDTPVPTNTPKPTRAPAPKPAAPKQEQPKAQEAAAPAAAPAQSQKQFSGQLVKWWPNCGSTGAKGKVLDKSGNPVNGLRIRLWTDGWDGAYSLVSGVGLSYGPGDWDLLLRAGQTGNFKIAVSDWQTGPDQYQPVESDVVNLEFDYNQDTCQPEGAGHQWAEVIFTRNF